MVENERDEGVDVDALDRVLDKLTRSFGILTKSIDDLAKASKKGAGSSSVDHQLLHKNRMREQAQAVANVEAMKRLAAELKGGGSQLKMFTGYLTKGIAAGAVFEKLTGHLGEYVDVNNNLRSAQEELILLVKKYGAIGDEKGEGKDKRWAKADPADRKRAQELQEQTKDKQGSKMLDQLSGAKEFFKKHKMGILIGAASAGVLIAILKKAFDSSPMFQSMLKLWHYGIMLVLRPIGDFFGFVMRPIMILLLRKFIIPWYTTMLPLMQTFGDQLGKLVIGVGGKLLKGDIAGAFALLFEGVDLTTKLGTILKDLIWGVLKAVIPVFAVSDIITGLFGIGNSEWFTKWSSAAVKWFKEGLVSATANWDEMWTIIKTWFSLGVSVIGAVWGKFWDVISIWFGEGVASVVAIWDDFWKGTIKWFDEGLAGMITVWNKFWDDIYTWFSEGVAGVVTAWDNFWKSTWKWFSEGVTSIGAVWDNFWDDVYTWFSEGIDSIVSPFQDIWKIVMDWLKSIIKGGKSKTSSTTVSHAEGGQINEHIFGIGESGQMYEFGERGSETVIPNSKMNNNNMGGSATININIGRIEKDADFEKLKPLIQRWILEANSRRGMI